MGNFEIDIVYVSNNMLKHTLFVLLHVFRVAFDFQSQFPLYAWSGFAAKRPAVQPAHPWIRVASNTHHVLVLYLFRVAGDWENICCCIHSRLRLIFVGIFYCMCGQASRRNARRLGG